MGSEGYRQYTSEVESLAAQDLRSTAALGARLLERSAGAIGSLEDGDQPVARSLRALRGWAEDLHPRAVDPAHPAPWRRFGLLPARDPLRAYLSRWTGAEEQVERLVGTLRDAQARLTADNAANAQEQLAFWTQMSTLRQYDYLYQQLDAGLSRRIDAVADPGRAQRLRQDVLFAVRRRRQEILTQLAVAVQGHAALEIIQDNNRAVIRAIQGATTSTLAAMQTALAVSQALANQRRLKQQLEGLDSPNAQVEVLQRAWAALSATLDQLESDRERAVASMSASVREVSGLLRERAAG